MTGKGSCPESECEGNFKTAFTSDNNGSSFAQLSHQGMREDPARRDAEQGFGYVACRSLLPCERVSPTPVAAPPTSYLARRAQLPVSERFMPPPPLPPPPRTAPLTLAPLSFTLSFLAQRRSTSRWTGKRGGSRTTRKSSNIRWISVRFSGRWTRARTRARTTLRRTCA